MLVRVEPFRPPVVGALLDQLVYKRSAFLITQVGIEPRPQLRKIREQEEKQA